MDLWSRIFAAGYDRFMAGQERAVLGRHRRALLDELSGSVLEIGGGTGANLAYYGPSIDRILITEPEEAMARRLRAKLDEHRLPAEVTLAPAENLPADDASVDTVVSTLVLCTVRDPVASLREIKRVLKPGGRLQFLEHVRSDDPSLARWQDRLQGVWAVFGRGCRCNRPTIDTIRRAGFEVAEVRRDELKRAVPIVKPLVVGTAIKPAAD